ncbi:MAG: hypothetical protein R3E32_00620 [Chitinophagales bacterium]
MSKIPTFTPQEMTILSDKNFLLTKRVALEKIMTLFGELAQHLQQLPIHQGFTFPKGTDAVLGKISKGDNYKGLPYMVLDFPKLFHKNAVFAYRSMFWWGDSFSFTLHLSGACLLQYQDVILNNLDKLQQEEVYFCCNDTPWEYDFGIDNYIRLSDVSKSFIAEKITQTGFIKLSRQLPLQDWQEVIAYGSTTYTLFLQCLKT